MPMGPGTQEPRSGIPIRSLCFLDNERLAVTFVTRASGRPELQKRGEPGTTGSAFQLDGVLIEARSGKVISRPVWPSSSKYAGIVAANDQGFVIQRDDALELLSAESKLVKRMPLSPLPADEYAHDSFWTPHPSWSGRRLLMLGWRNASSIWLWVDTDNLEVLKSWQDVRTGSVAATEHQLVMQVNSKHTGDPPPFLEASVPAGPWKPLRSTADAYAAQFVGQNLLYFKRVLARGMPPESAAFLMRTDDEELIRLESPRSGWGLGPAAVSRAGNRFVIIIGETKGAYWALDIGGHQVLRGLIIYDAPFELPVYTLAVQHSKIRNPDIVALSPDGRHLAVLSYPESIVEVFELPTSRTR
jgi:hypothetical protein